MERETAYTLSDVLIQRMDRLTTVSEISALHNAMIRDFTRRMQEVRRAHAYSIHVSKAISYISAHLHEKLTTQDIADAISLNRSYLSTLSAVRSEKRCTNTCSPPSFNPLPSF